MQPTDDSTRPSDERYVVVARRYRPKSFGELVGQQHVGQALCNAIETGRVGHAYLFTGARGVGKTSTARIFAKALNDPGGPTCSPDGSSDVAQAIDAGEDVDVLEIDGASNRGIDEIRSLRANIGVRPSRSRFKIYIIDEVHMLTGAAFNALLKTLEEPPPHVKFIFCTTDPEKLPITVLSRCQRFDFSPVKSEEIMGRLREIVTSEGVKADDEALRLIARRADGSMRDSQSLLEQVISFSSGGINAQTVHVMLGTADDTRLHELASTLAAGDAYQALRLIDQAATEGIAAGQLAEQLLGYFRDILAVAVGCPAEMQRHAGESLHDELKRLGASWGLERLLAIVGMIDQTIVRIRHTVHGRVLLEATLVQICHLPDLQSLADLATAIASGTSSSPSPSGVKPAARPVSPAQANAPSFPSVSDAAPEKKNVEAVRPSQTLRVPNDSASHAMSPGLSQSQADSDTRIDPKQSSKPLGHDISRPLTSPALAGASETPPSLASSAAQVATRQTTTTTAVAASSEGTRYSPAATSSVSVGPNAAPSTAVAKTRLQRIREMEAHDYVKRCMEIFDGEIIRIDTPR